MALRGRRYCCGVCVCCVKIPFLIPGHVQFAEKLADRGSQARHSSSCSCSNSPPVHAFVALIARWGQPWWYHVLAHARHA